MAAVGFLLLRWGQLEARLGGVPVLNELKDVRDMRNDLCHGLVSAHADPATDTQPYLVCESVRVGRVEYSWSELQAAIARLEGTEDRLPTG